MNSFDLVRELHARGTLTKEAAVSILKSRERLIKQAYAAEAQRLVENIFGLAKTAGIGDFIRGTEKAGIKTESFLQKMRLGGLTAGKTAPPNSASWTDVGSNLLKMLGIAGLSAGATAGVSSLVRHKRDSDLQKDISSSYKQMFDLFPELKEENADRVRTHFGVLAKYAPSMAADPTVAGSFVQNSARMGQIEPTAIKVLAETQRRIDEMHEARSPFASHFDRSLNFTQKAINPAGKSGSSGG